MHLIRVPSLEKSSYERAKKIIEQGMKEKSFAVELNVLLPIMREKDFQTLKILLSSSKFLLPYSTKIEIDGLIHGGLDSNTKGTLIDFMIRFPKNKIIHFDDDKLKNQLLELTPLLPRKVVHDIMISNSNSFIKNLESKYFLLVEKAKKNSLTRVDITRIADEYSSAIDSLDQLFGSKFIELCKMLKINPEKIDQKSYFEFIIFYKNELLMDIEKIRKNSKDFAAIISVLDELASKIYDADINFVATIISHGIRGGSLDSDVTFLFDFYALKYACLQ
jgi:hypothetical protein